MDDKPTQSAISPRHGSGDFIAVGRRSPVACSAPTHPPQPVQPFPEPGRSLRTETPNQPSPKPIPKKPSVEPPSGTFGPPWPISVLNSNAQSRNVTVPPLLRSATNNVQSPSGFVPTNPSRKA